MLTAIFLLFVYLANPPQVLPENPNASYGATMAQGTATWYQTGHHTACGYKFDPRGITVALTQRLYTRQLCGQPMRITYKDRSVIAIITDVLPSDGHLIDMSRGTKELLGAGDLSRVTIEY